MNRPLPTAVPTSRAHALFPPLRRLAALFASIVVLTGCLDAPPGVLVPCPPPQIINLYPSDGSTDVPVDDTIQIVFDHPIDTSTVDTTTVFIVQDGDTLPVDIFFEPCIGGFAKRTHAALLPPQECGTIVYIDPQGDLLPDVPVDIIVTPGIEDTAGTPFDDTLTFTFTTEDTLPDPPPWIDVFPEPGGEDVPVDVVIEVSFDDDPPGPNDSDRIVLTLGNDTIPGTTNWDPLDSTLTFDPTDSLLGDTTYTVILTVPDDCVGALCPADSTYTWTFTTEDPEEPPPPPLPPPQLIRFADQHVLVGVSPSGAPISMHWTAVASATSYTFQLSTSPTFGTLIIQRVGSPATSYVDPTPVVFPGNTYYWRVNATGPGGTSAWSVVRTFTVTL